MLHNRLHSTSAGGPLLPRMQVLPDPEVESDDRALESDEDDDDEGFVPTG